MVIVIYVIAVFFSTMAIGWSFGVVWQAILLPVFILGAIVVGKIAP